jgi:histidine triad (HIT) family protein
MEMCIFCQIINKERPAYIVYEDDKFLSFLDKYPLTKGNCLVIPKKHVRWVDDVENFGAYFELAKRIGKAAQRAFFSVWTQYLTIGHEIPHAHIRVIPRYEGDKHGPVPNLSITENYNDDEKKIMAEQIIKELSTR